MALKSGATMDRSAQNNLQPPVEDTVLLELTMYTHYTWQGTTYEKGTPYKFTRDAAMSLLSTLDYGRPVWRLYRPRTARRPVVPVVVDATNVVPVDEEGIPGTPPPPGKRIDIGFDDEIADILNRPGGEGDITV